MALVDGVSFQAQAAGAGAFVYGSPRPSFLTPLQAVALSILTDGQTVSYLAQDSITSPTQREWGHGTFSTASNSVARTTVLGSVNGGSAGSGSPISFGTAPIVSLTVLAEDLTTTPTSPTPFDGAATLIGAQNNFATYNIFDHMQGPYWVNLNLFNVGSLTGYTFNAICYPGTFPTFTTFEWVWPTPASILYGYPEIIYGLQGGGAFGGGPPNKPTPKALNSLGTLVLTYNLTLTIQSGDDTSYLIETWAQTIPGNQATITDEILFYAYATPAVSSFILSFPINFNYSVGGFNVYFAHDTGSNRVYMMPVTAPSGTTALNMTQQGQTYVINFAALITAALNAGWLNGTDLIGGYEIGFETRQGTGSAVFNHLEWTWA